MLSRRTFVGAAARVHRSPARTQAEFRLHPGGRPCRLRLGLRWPPLGGNPESRQIASEGTRFASHYCNSPVCTPSRQSFFTGQMPHAAGVTTLSTSLDPAKLTIAKQLKQAGYKTAVFGKMHFNRPDDPVCTDSMKC